MMERWRDIRGWPDHGIPEWPFHQVSDRGRARRLPGARVGPGKRLVRKSELLWINNSGRYPRIPRYGLKPGKWSPVYFPIHRLMLFAFRGPPKPDEECRHLNGNKFDNRLRNLKWGTRSENIGDMIAHGTFTMGERQWMSKLTESEVEAIQQAEPWRTGTGLARQYGVSPVTIHQIRTGKTWKHVGRKP